MTNGTAMHLLPPGKQVQVILCEANVWKQGRGQIRPWCKLSSRTRSFGEDPVPYMGTIHAQVCVAARTVASRTSCTLPPFFWGGGGSCTPCFFGRAPVRVRSSTWCHTQPQHDGVTTRVGSVSVRRRGTISNDQATAAVVSFSLFFFPQKEKKNRVRHNTCVSHSMNKLNDDYPYWRSRWRCGCIPKAAGSLIRTAQKRLVIGDGNSTNCMVVDQSPRLLGGPCSASRPCRKGSLEPFVDKLCPKWKTPVGDGQKKRQLVLQYLEKRRKRNSRLHTQQKSVGRR